MLHNVKIIPLVGINWNEKQICLLDSKEVVEASLGEPCTTYDNQYYYCNSELRFDFDKHGKVKFIEFLAGINGVLQPEIYGVSAFGTSASVLIELLKEKNDGEVEDNENGYSFGFLNISVGVYRPSIPDSVEEMIEEAKEDGDSMDTEEIEYEMQRANHWATIGIGVKDYYL